MKQVLLESGKDYRIIGFIEDFLVDEYLMMKQNSLSRIGICNYVVMLDNVDRITNIVKDRFGVLPLTLDSFKKIIGFEETKTI
jgi:hypothetical protein